MKQKSLGSRIKSGFFSSIEIIESIERKRTTILKLSSYGRKHPLASIASATIKPFVHKSINRATLHIKHRN